MVLRTRNAIYTRKLYEQVEEDFQRLKELEQLRDNLTHMIVHDMRSPLQGILLSLEFLEESTSLVDETDKMCLAGGLASARLLIEMVSSLLDVSRLEAGQMPLHRTPCDLVKVAQSSVDMLSGLFKKSPVILDGPPEGCSLACDEGLIQRVIMNLLGNAAKYSPGGRPIRLRIQREPGGVRLAVTDEGRGIPPEYHKRIFEKFGQVESGGDRKKYSTGIGLTFCRLAVEAHGGQIGVDSGVSKGSTFWFTLPDENPKVS